MVGSSRPTRTERATRLRDLIGGVREWTRHTSRAPRRLVLLCLATTVLVAACRPESAPPVETAGAPSAIVTETRSPPIQSLEPPTLAAVVAPALIAAEPPDAGGDALPVRLRLVAESGGDLPREFAGGTVTVFPVASPWFSPALQGMVQTARRDSVLAVELPRSGRYAVIVRAETPSEQFAASAVLVVSRDSPAPSQLRMRVERRPLRIPVRVEVSIDEPATWSDLTVWLRGRDSDRSVVLAGRGSSFDAVVSSIGEFDVIAVALDGRWIPHPPSTVTIARDQVVQVDIRAVDSASVRIIDWRTGVPLSGARVTVAPGSAHLHPKQVHRANETGLVILPWRRTNTRWSACAEGYVDRDLSIPVDAARPYVIGLMPGGSLQVDVVGWRGYPLPPRPRFVYGRTSVRVTHGERQEIVVATTPSVSKGDATVRSSIRLAEHGPDYDWAEPTALHFRGTGGATLGFRAHAMLPGRGRLGTFPIVTKPERVPIGDYQVEVYPLGVQLAVRVTDDRAPIELELPPPRSFELLDRFVDEAARARSPISFEVFAWQEGGFRGKPVGCDVRRERGRYRFRAPPIDLVVFARARHRAKTRIDFPLTRDSARLSMPRAATVRVSVVDERGQALPDGARIRLCPTEPLDAHRGTLFLPRVGQAVTLFRALQPGRYEVEATPTRLAPYFDPIVQFVEVEAGESVEVVVTVPSRRWPVIPIGAAPDE